jgi:hypothetical protein
MGNCYPRRKLTEEEYEYVNMLHEIQTNVFTKIEDTNILVGIPFTKSRYTYFQIIKTYQLNHAKSYREFIVIMEEVLKYVEDELKPKLKNNFLIV